MGLESVLAFAVAMTVLAASPGPGLAIVISRSAISGSAAGYRVVLGLVVVDFFFLAIAIVGVSAISIALGPLFQLVKYLAAVYLIYLGIKTITSTVPKSVSLSQRQDRGKILKDVSLGVIVTLGNPKAILFYGAFLPAFFDVTLVGFFEFLAICGVIVFVSFAVYGTYISMLSRSIQSMTDSKLLRKIQTFSGAMLMGSGVIVAAR